MINGDIILKNIINIDKLYDMWKFLNIVTFTFTLFFIHASLFSFTRFFTASLSDFLLVILVFESLGLNIWYVKVSKYYHFHFYPFHHPYMLCSSLSLVSSQLLLAAFCRSFWFTRPWDKMMQNHLLGKLCSFIFLYLERKNTRKEEIYYYYY